MPLAAHTSEESPAAIATGRTQELLVLRRHPQGAIEVIGRLHYDGARYSYGYTCGARQIDGFQPLPGLGEPGDWSESTELFPVFQQRIMSSRRPGYERYMGQLGVDPAEPATVWRQLIRSGGYRVGDSLRFMPVPEVRNGVARASFLIHGIRHLPGKTLRLSAGEERTVDADEHERALAGLRPGDQLGLLPEPENSFSPRALLVTSRGTPLGYVPEVIATELAELKGASIRVEHIAGPEAPAHRRLFVRLEALAPEGFRFDPRGEWELLRLRG